MKWSRLFADKLPAREGFVRADQAEGARLLRVVMAMAAAGPPGLPAEQQGRALALLHAFLDLLDRKTASLVTFNSFLLAIYALVVFRPSGLFEPSAGLRIADLNDLRGVATVCSVCAVALSVTSLGFALGIFTMRWRFLAYAEFGETGVDLSRELEMLAYEAARKQHNLKRVWGAASSALWLTLGALLVIFLSVV
jgi:hypothetical protein